MYMTASATIRPNSKTKPSSPRLPCEIISPTRSTNQLLPLISWNNRLAFFLQMVSSLIRVAPFLDRLTVDCPTVEPLIQISTNSSITSGAQSVGLSKHGTGSRQQGSIELAARHLKQRTPN